MRNSLLSLLLLICTIWSASAGENDKYIGINAGLLYRNGFNSTISLEKETSYHNAWEIYGDLFTQWHKCPDCGKVCRESFWKYNRSWSVGVAYKPSIARYKNASLRFRGGADIGANSHTFIASVEIGLEYIYTFQNRVQFAVQQKNDFVFWGKDHFRNGVLIGIKLPF